MMSLTFKTNIILCSAGSLEKSQFLLKYAIRSYIEVRMKVSLCFVVCGQDCFLMNLSFNKQKIIDPDNLMSAQYILFFRIYLVFFSF